MSTVLILWSCQSICDFAMDILLNKKGSLRNFSDKMSNKLDVTFK